MNPNWRDITPPTSQALDDMKSKVRQVETALTGFVNLDRLDQTEADIIAATAALKDLRMQVRQMRAEARVRRAA
jgi:hypothetical protein